MFIEPVAGGVKLLRVLNKSVAEAADLAAGDIIFSAAGVPVRESRDLSRVIGRQSPGTWLPLGIRRGDRELIVVAKFPAQVGATN